MRLPVTRRGEIAAVDAAAKRNRHNPLLRPRCGRGCRAGAGMVLVDDVTLFSFGGGPGPWEHRIRSTT